MKLSPAEYVIFIFGGVRRTARLLGRDPSAIVRWRKPKEAKGTGGKIPTHARMEILKKAAELKLDINSEHLDFGRDIPEDQINGVYERQKAYTKAGTILP